MDIAKIKSPKAQSVVTASSVNLILSELLFEGTGGVKADTSSGTISVKDAGYYLVCYDALVVGAGAPTIFLSGNGINAIISGIAFLQFAGDGTGVSKGNTMLIKATAGAQLGLFVINSSGVTLTFNATLGVVKIADV